MKTNKELLDFKGRPDYFLPSLEIIHNYEGNWKKIWKNLTEFAKTKLSSKAKEDNIVSAYITPPLRKLDLIEGEKNELRLTTNGLQCLENFKKGGITEYKKHLGLILIKTDEQHANFISSILTKYDSTTKATSIENLVEDLANIGIKVSSKGTRIRGWLFLLQFVDLIDSDERGYFYLQKSQYDVFLNGETIPSTTEFITAILDSSKKLKFKTKGSPYLPIPEVRRFVCNKLQMLTFRFNDMLKKIPSTYKDSRFIFETPNRKLPKGITIKGKYYYFIGVF